MGEARFFTYRHLDERVVPTVNCDPIIPTHPHYLLFNVPQLVSKKAEWLVAPPVGTPSPMERRFFTQLELVHKQLKEQGEATDDLRVKVNKLNTLVLYPLCIRQLCTQAAERINIEDGDKHGSGTMKPRPNAPEWAKAWLIKVSKASGGSVDLVDLDLTMIYATTPGSKRDEGNKAAHSDIKEPDQAAAVLAVADVLERESLSRIFAFVYGHQPTL